MNEKDSHPLWELLLHNEIMRMTMNMDLIRGPMPNEKNEEEMDRFYTQHADDINKAWKVIFYTSRKNGHFSNTYCLCRTVSATSTASNRPWRSRSRSWRS